VSTVYQYVKLVSEVYMSNDIIESLKNELAVSGGVDDDTRAVAGGSVDC